MTPLTGAAGTGARVDDTPPPPSTPSKSFNYTILLIGFVATSAIAVGLYFASMEFYKVWNPFDYSVDVQMGLTIAGSCIFGIAGIVGSFFWAKSSIA